MPIYIVGLVFLWNYSFCLSQNSDCTSNLGYSLNYHLQNEIFDKLEKLEVWNYYGICC